MLLVLTSNRGLAGGYNSNVMRTATCVYQDFLAQGVNVRLEVAGKRGINYCKFRGFPVDLSFTNFEDRPQFDQVEEIANRYIESYIGEKIDQVVVAYTRFVSASRKRPKL